MGLGAEAEPEAEAEVEVGLAFGLALALALGEGFAQFDLAAVVTRADLRSGTLPDLPDVAVAMAEEDADAGGGSEGAAVMPSSTSAPSSRGAGART